MIRYNDIPQNYDTDIPQNNVSGNVLAVRVGQETYMGEGVVDMGLFALLSVNTVMADVQTTTFYGQSLYLIWYNVGQLDAIQGFTYITKQYYNKSKEWYQLVVPPLNPLLLTSRIYLVPQPPPPDPISHGMMTLILSGYDPLIGYWLQFQGNFDLNIPIFKGFNVTHRTPNYQIKQN